VNGELDANVFPHPPFLVEENKVAEKVRDFIHACQPPVVAEQAKKS